MRLVDIPARDARQPTASLPPFHPFTLVLSHADKIISTKQPLRMKEGNVIKANILQFPWWENISKKISSLHDVFPKFKFYEF